MPWIDSLDWSSLNAIRRYPLREGSSALSTDGFFSIPDDLIVDFTLTASSDITKRFYISRIFNKLSSVVIDISDNNDVVVGTFTIASSSHNRDSDYYMVTTNNYVGANGKMTVGTLDSLLRQPAGNFSFTLGSAELEPRTIIPGIKGIDRIKFSDVLNGDFSMTGDVTITARNNMLFEYDPTRSTVLVDAGDDLGLNKECDTPNCVKSINGVRPNPSDGNITLVGIDCIRVSSSAQYTLDLEDTCCTPCSGCDDLANLTTRVTTLENKFLELKNFYNSANAQITTYLATVNSNCSCP